MYLNIIKCEYRYSNQNRLFYQRIHLCPGTENNVFCKLIIGRNMCDIPLGKKCDQACGFCEKGTKEFYLMIIMFLKIKKSLKALKIQ